MDNREINMANNGQWEFDLRYRERESNTFTQEMSGRMKQAYLSVENNILDLPEVRRA